MGQGSYSGFCGTSCNEKRQEGNFLWLNNFSVLVLYFSKSSRGLKSCDCRLSLLCLFTYTFLGFVPFFQVWQCRHPGCSHRACAKARALPQGEPKGSRSSWKQQMYCGWRALPQIRTSSKCISWD